MWPTTGGAILTYNMSNNITNLTQKKESLPDSEKQQPKYPNRL